MTEQTAALDRVEMTVTHTVTILGSSGKPALELEVANGDVKVSPLPRNSGRRDTVKLADLRAAVDALAR